MAAGQASHSPASLFLRLSAHSTSQVPPSIKCLQDICEAQMPRNFLGLILSDFPLNKSYLIVLYFFKFSFSYASLTPYSLMGICLPFQQALPSISLIPPPLANFQMPQLLKVHAQPLSFLYLDFLLSNLISSLEVLSLHCCTKNISPWRFFFLKSKFLYWTTFQLSYLRDLQSSSNLTKANLKSWPPKDLRLPMLW